ncbi:molecular chaperone TorD family protein [Desulfovibrio mangrovi]|uniref:TorD/DmsD family molecular chaperone n=1 Tax=Desulfovibrio mangrovi TaxID=2976983 RepID=UPI0022470266|nr:molecular chaperone TorD family protein [Desulfovibrio mangrovi]UZP68078.1 molecular chaperone TorD family protein [Desulfovibrio mangrovi]
MKSGSESRIAAWCNALFALAHCYREPGDSFPAYVTMLDESLNALAISQTVPAPLHQSLTDTEPAELLRDYARLFIGPFELFAAPFGSVYLEEGRRIMGETTYDALHHYQAAGLEVSADFGNPPDHLSAELEFMYYLLHKEMQARVQNDMQGSARCRSQLTAFVNNHPARWIDPFCTAVQESAATPFYHTLASLTRTTLQTFSPEILSL